MTEPTPGLDLPKVKTPDPLYFQQASMLMLAFRFQGTRKVVASRLLTRDDFVAELIDHLPVLDRVYADWDVSGVEVVSFQRGAFYYDDWPDAMKIVRAYRQRQDEAADRTSEPSAADSRVTDTEAA